MAKWKKDKRTNNDPQNITHKTKDGVTRAPLKTHITLYYLFCLSSLCVLCTQCCQFYLDCRFVIAPSVFSGLSISHCPFSFLWIVHSWLPLQFSLDCPFMIVPSVFSDVYLYNRWLRIVILCYILFPSHLPCFQQLLNYYPSTTSTFGTGTAYPFGVPEFTSGFLIGLYYSSKVVLSLFTFNYFSCHIITSLYLLRFEYHVYIVKRIIYLGGFSHLLFNYTKVIITVVSKVQHKSASYSRFIDFVLAFGKKDVFMNCIE